MSARSAGRIGRKVGQGWQVRGLGRRQIRKRWAWQARHDGAAERGSGEESDGDVDAVIVQCPTVAAAGFERGGRARAVEDIGEERRVTFLACASGSGSPARWATLPATRATRSRWTSWSVASAPALRSRIPRPGRRSSLAVLSPFLRRAGIWRRRTLAAVWLTPGWHRRRPGSYVLSGRGEDYEGLGYTHKRSRRDRDTTCRGGRSCLPPDVVVTPVNCIPRTKEMTRSSGCRPGRCVLRDPVTADPLTSRDSVRAGSACCERVNPGPELGDLEVCCSKRAVDGQADLGQAGRPPR